MTFDELLHALRPQFPRLTSENSRPTSPFDEGYNCIAWAAGDTARWWWPDAMGQGYWPQGVPREVSIEAFALAYAHLGYNDRSNHSLDTDALKVAIYADARGRPTHAARQLPDGWWTSKLGQQIDIEHELTALDGPVYGSVAVILAKKQGDRNLTR